MEIALYQVRTFLEVMRTGSLTKAGRKLGYSQSTVTAHIRALETQAGAPLFRRLPHGVHPTPDGEIFHDYAVRISSLVSELTVSLSTDREVSGRVSVGVSALTVDQELTRLILECRYRYPKLDVCPVVMDSPRIVEEVGSRRLDMGIVMSPPDADFDGVNLLSEDLRRVELTAVTGSTFSSVIGIGADHSAGKGAGNHRSTEVHMLRMDTGGNELEGVRSAIRRSYGMIPEFLPAGSVHSALELMRDRPCIAVLPLETVAREIESGELRILRDVPREQRVVRMIWNDQTWLPPTLVAALELTRRLAPPVSVPVRLVP
ncbi:LysR family transcriptional regulator [Streptomyces sp. NPDC002778]